MKTIRQYKRVEGIERYYSFDAERFLQGKTLVIENVKKEKIEDIPCIKVDLRIIKDENTQTDHQGQIAKRNEGKVFTLRIDYNDEAPEDFEIATELLKNPRGHYAEVTNMDLIDHYIYQGSCLILTSGMLTVFEEKAERQPIDRGDRSLNSLNRFKTFDFERFIRENTIRIDGIQIKGKSDVRLIAHVKDRGFFEIKIPVDDYRNLPHTLLMVAGDFNDVIESFELDYTSALNYNTEILVVMKSVTFKQGVLADTSIQIPIDVATEHSDKQKTETKLNHEHEPKAEPKVEPKVEPKKTDSVWGKYM